MPDPISGRPLRAVLSRPPGAWLWVACLLVLAGCARETQPAIPALPELSGATGIAAPRINGDVGTPQATASAQLAYGSSSPQAQPQNSAVSAHTPGDISLDFSDTDIRDVVSQILGNMLKVNYTIDPSVHGAVTFHTAHPLRNDELLPTLQMLLAEVGAGLVQSPSLYQVVSAAQAASYAAVGTGSGSVAVPLRYASAEDLAKLLQPYVRQGGKVTADPNRNALIVSGEPDARESLLALVQAFDIDLLSHQSYALLPVAEGDVRDFAAALGEALRATNGSAAAGLVRIVPLARIGAVLVISAQSRYIEEARRVYGLVDRTRRQTLRSWHVYYLQNSHAEDTAYTLQQAFTPGNVTAQPSGQGGGGLGAQRTSGFGDGAGTLGSGSLGSGIGGFGQNGFNQGGFGQGGFGQGGSGQGGFGLGGAQSSLANPGGPAGSATAAPGARPPTAQGSTANPLLGGLDTGGGEPTPDSMRIIPDKQNNALLVYGTVREIGTVEAMLHKLDILPLQVRIDAVIAEVTLNDNLRYGTQFFFKSGGINGVLGNGVQTVTGPLSTAAFNTTLPGFVVGGPNNGGAPLALSALQAVTTVNVLSSPQLMVLDNQPARLQVGNVVPYLSQTSQSALTPNAPVISSINYQQTGVIMEVTPRVSSGGLVTLDIMQDVSGVQTTLTTPQITSPTFSERNVTSRVVVQDGQTIGLAGLITDNVTRNNEGIPWLKDIPLLGVLAGTQDNTRQRTELLVLVTPHVVHDQRDARALTEDLRDQLINAAALPYQLNGLRPGGSSDPNARLRRGVGLQP